MLYFLSGMPRSGSTLLSSILSQNPEIHAEGNSAVCQLMWDMQESCEKRAAEQLLANNKKIIQDELIKEIPKIYYKNVQSKYIVDKCRSWTLPLNIKMLKRYITNDPKIIVLTRPLEEVVESFASIRKKNNWKDPYAGLTDPMSEPIMRSLFGVDSAKKNNNGEFLFIEYSDMINKTENSLKKIYEFMEWTPYKHNLTNIVNPYPENDSVYGINGLHEIRPTIGFSK